MDAVDRDFELAEEPAKSRAATWAALVVGVVMLAFIAFLASRLGVADGGRSGAGVALTGQLAPALAGDTLDGERYDIDDQRGRWVVVNFFSTWCPPCVLEHPELAEFAERNADGDRRLVSVVFNDDESDVREFVSENGASWPIVLDPGGSVAFDYATISVPETLLVAPSGVVVAKLTGGVTADQLDGLINSIEAAS